MIRGRVQLWGGPVFSLLVRGPSGREQRVEVQVDTGFSGFLTMPQAIVDALTLASEGSETVELSDGGIAKVPTFRGSVTWDGEQRDITIHCTECRPLVGVALLWGSRLEIDFEEHGLIAISPLA